MRLKHILMRYGSPAIILGFAVLAYHAPALLYGRTYYSDDILSQHFPSFVYAARRFSEGQIPLWNPHQFSGFPFLADTTSQLLYPPVWLLLLLGPQHVMWFIVLHYFLAGLFMYWLAHRFNITSCWAKLTASVIFVFSGFLLLQVPGLLVVCAYAWIPLTILFADQAVERPSVRAGLKLGLVFTIQVLSGGVQIALGAAYLVLIYMLVGLTSKLHEENTMGTHLLRQIFHLALGGVIGLSVAAAQILPSAELAQVSVRGAGLSYSWASMYSLAPSRLLSLFIPGIWVKPASYAEASAVGDGRLGYAGTITIVLLLVACFLAVRNGKVRFFLIATVGFLALALGRYGWLYPLAFQFLPGFQHLRAPVRYLSLYVFCTSIVAGLVLEWLQSASVRRIRQLALSTLVLLAVELGIGVTLRPDSFWTVMGLPLVSLGLLAIVTLAVSFLFVPQLVLAPVFLCLIVGDLYLFGLQQHFPITSKEIFDLTSLQPIGKWLEQKQMNEYFRVYWPDHLQVEENGALYDARAPMTAIWNLSGVEGYSQLKPEEYDRFWQHLPLTRTLELLNVKYVVADATDVPSLSLVPKFSDRSITVFRTPSYLPRAFIAQRCRSVQPQEAIDILAQTFNPVDEVLLGECPSSLSISWPDKVQGRVEIVRYQPERIELSAHLPYEGVLVLSEPYFPGWTCNVDGRDVKILRADAILRALILSPGTHQIIFAYSPISVRIGAIVSVIGLLLCIVVCLYKRQRDCQ